MKLDIQKFASGSFEFPNWTGNYAIRGKIEWSSTSSIDENKSVVTASIYVRRTSGYTTGKLWNGYVNIGGNNHTYSQIYTGTSTTVRQDWVLVQTFSDTILHNADGTKTINISGQVTGPSGTGLEGKSSWGDSNVTLDTIPRASTPTLSSSSVTMGNSVTITTNRVSNSFTHTISYSFGSATGTIATNVTDTASWTPPITLANQIPNSASGSCTIICQTYNGTTLIGTKQVTLTLNVPSSVVPSVSIGTLTEANAQMQTLNWGVFVQNKSQLNIPITATGIYGSSISSIVTTINGLSFTGSPVTTSTLITSGTNTISTTVTDTRGRTATTTKTYTVVAYSNPQITTATAVRSLSDGTESDEGTYLKYSFVGSISPVSNHNAHNFKIGYKLKSYSTYTYVDIDTTNYSLNDTDEVLNLNLDTNSAYDIIFVVTDTFTSSSIGRAIETGFDLMNFNASGKAMAIGKVSEAGANEELLEIGIPFKQIDNNKYLKSSYDGSYYWKIETDANEYSFDKKLFAVNGLFTPGGDIVLGSSSGTNDSGDLLWSYGNGTEKTRIWTDNTPDGFSWLPHIRTYNSSGTYINGGRILSNSPLQLGDQNILTLEPGFYFREGFSGWTENGWPVSTWHCNLWIFGTASGNDGWRTLVCFDSSNNELWVRNQQWNGWADWKKIATYPVTLYDNTTGIQSGNYITIDNLSSYKKLQITFTMYPASTSNQGGASNIIWMDLTRNVSNTCRCGVVVPYLADSITGSSMGTDFRAVFEGNLSNNRLYCFFAYGTQEQIGGYYVMTKVLGYKY